MRQLIDMVRRGEMALPDFQRGFVWSPLQVSELLESVANGWPVGSLLLLEGPQPFEIEPIDGGPNPSKDKVRFYLLDGQQRITALFHALTDKSEYVYFVDLFAEEFEVKYSPRKSFATATGAVHRIALNALLDPNSDQFQALPPTLRNRANVFLREDMPGLADPEYRIPGTVLANNIELDALTRIFETLNRTGEKLDAFDLMVAVLRPDGFLLRSRWEEAVDLYPRLALLEADGLEVLKLIALRQMEFDRVSMSRPASRRVRGVRQRDVLNTPSETVISLWDQTVEWYARALDFLWERGGVRDAESMPSWAMVLTCAFLLGEGEDSRQVERWYWTSILDQSYAQGANTQVVADVYGRWKGDHVAKLSSLLLVALQQPARRSRIVRLGLRGAVRRSGATDALTGEPLNSPLAEISVADFANGPTRLGPEDSVADMALCQKASTSVKRFDLFGIRSQGFNTTEAESSFNLNARTSFFADLLENWL